jgi:ABC-2 type transport system ATP-binding protein
MMNSVSADDVRVVRGGREVLHGIGFRLPAGEVTGLLGPSGCGKTTLMRALVGVQRGVTGRIDVLGMPAGHPALRTKVGYVTQAPAVYLDLSVRDNLAYFAAVTGAAAGRVATVLEQVRLGGRAGQLVQTLSGGERARVSLATALLSTPELLVLDEPTVGLDPLLRRDLWLVFRELAAAGTTLLVSSHVMDEASRCDRLVLMRDGRLVADEPVGQLLRRTGTTDVEQAFVALAEAAA